MRRKLALSLLVKKKHKDMKNTDYTPAQQMDSLVSSQSSLDALKELIDDLDLQVVKVTRS